jgi:hypothetical protein
MSPTSRRIATPRKRYKPEEIVAKLRQVDVLVSQGQVMADAIRQIGVYDFNRMVFEFTMLNQGKVFEEQGQADRPGVLRSIEFL